MSAAKRFLLHDSHVEFLNADLGRFGPVRVTCKRCGQTETAAGGDGDRTALNVALTRLDDTPCAIAVIGPDGLPHPAASLNDRG